MRQEGSCRALNRGGSATRSRTRLLRNSEDLSCPSKRFRDHLQELPLDLVLGVLARISAHFVRDGQAFFSPSCQGRYLSYALADIPIRASWLCIDVRAGPNTDYRRAAQIHPRAWSRRIGAARHPSLPKRFRYSGDNASRLRSDRPPPIDPQRPPRRRVSGRVARRPARTTAPRDRHLHAFQFNGVAGYEECMIDLARAHHLLADFLPKHLPNAATAFSVRAGIGLNEYMLAAAMLLGYSNQLPKNIDSKQSPWVSVDNIVANVKSHNDEIRHVLSLACQTAADLHRDRPTRGSADLFEFATLQRRPLIEARTGEIVAPVLSLFVRQLLSFPFQILSEIENGLGGLGRAYEDYAHEVVSRIAKTDGAGAWKSTKGQVFESGEVDSILWRDATAIVFEHKSKGLLLTLGDRPAVRNALGPNDRDIADLGMRRPSDSSAITHGLWQLANLSECSEAFFVPRFGSVPER